MLNRKDRRRSVNSVANRRRRLTRAFRIEQLEARQLLANDTLASASLMQLLPDIPVLRAAAIGDEDQPNQDVDMYRFDAASGESIEVLVTSQSADGDAFSSNLNTRVRVFDASGAELELQSLPGSGNDNTLGFTAATSGTYYVGVSDAANGTYDPAVLTGRTDNATSGAYHLQVVKHEPSDSDYFPNHYLVTTLADLLPADDGQLSLREAVEKAGSEAGRDLIEFAPGLGTAAIELRWGPLSITGDTVIRGNAISGTDKIRITRSALSGADHFFEVAAGAHLGLEKIALDGAQTSGDGGAILVSGQLDMDTVSIEHATAARGAAVFVAAGGSATIHNSTLAENSATDRGGAVYVAAGGSLSVFNSTLSTNEAGQGGAVTNLGTAAFLNATLAENTATIAGAAAGLDSAGTTYLRNTLIGQQSQGTDLVGTVESLGFNVVSDAQDATGLNSSIGDRFGGVAGQAALSVGIGPLQTNGGFGRTHQLLVGSPAIDLGNRFGLSEKDQRGAPRLLDGPDLSSAVDTVRQGDAGAFEFGGFFLTTTDDKANTATAADGRVDADSGQAGDDVTLRAALQEIRAIAQPRIEDSVPQVRFESQIIVPEKLYLLQITLLGNDDDGAAGDLDIVGDVTITAPAVAADAAPYSISGDYESDRVLQVHQGSRLVLNSINVEGGRAIRGSDGISKGGGVFNDGGTLELHDATFIRGRGTPAVSDISANMTDRGAAVYTAGGSLLIDSVRMAFGEATLGGGLFVESRSVSIDGLKLDNNTALQAGGALYIAGGNLVADGMVVEDNRTILTGLAPTGATQGAGIYTAGGNSSIAHLTLERNRRYDGSPGGTDWGGGLYNAGTLLLSDATISDNGVHNMTEGTSIYNVGNLRLVRTNMTGTNNADSEARLVFNDAHGVITAEQSSFKRQFGQVFYNQNATLTLFQSTIADNSTSSYGAAVVNADLDSKLNIIDSIISGNVSQDSGAVLNMGGSVTVRNSTFLDNWNGIVGGGAITHIGTPLPLVRTPLPAVELAAAINSQQNILYVNNAERIAKLDVPFTIQIDDEQMVVREVDVDKGRLTVERQQGQKHTVATPVGVIIDTQETLIFLNDLGLIPKYQLPLDILIDDEVMTVREVNVEANTLRVERGRRGTVPAQHTGVLLVFGVSGGLDIAGSTFANNVTGSDHVGIGQAPVGGAVYSRIHSSTAPTTITDSTFSDNVGLGGNTIFAEVYPTPVIKPDDPLPLRGTWDEAISATELLGRPETLRDKHALNLSGTVVSGGSWPTGPAYAQVVGATSLGHNLVETDISRSMRTLPIAARASRPFCRMTPAFCQPAKNSPPLPSKLAWYEPKTIRLSPRKSRSHRLRKPPATIGSSSFCERRTEPRLTPSQRMRH